MRAKITIPALQQMKRDGRKIVGVVVYDYQMAQIVDREYPVGSLAALNKPGTRLFTLDFWAGYVIDQSWPRVLVYQDTRVDMYGTTQTRRPKSDPFLIKSQPRWPSFFN